MELNYFDIVGENILQLTELHNNRDKAKYEQEIQGLAQMYLEELEKAKNNRAEISKINLPVPDEYEESFDSVSEISVEPVMKSSTNVQNFENPVLNQNFFSKTNETVIDPFESGLPEPIKTEVYKDARPIYSPVFDVSAVKPVENLINRNLQSLDVSEIEERIEEKIRQQTPSIEEEIIAEIVPPVKTQIPKKDEMKMAEITKKLENVRKQYASDTESSISEINSKSVALDAYSDHGVCSEDSIIEYLSKRREKMAKTQSNDGAKTPTQKSLKKMQVEVDSESSGSESRNSLLELDELSKLFAKAKKTVERDIIKSRKISILESQLQEIESLKKNVTKYNVDSLRDTLSRWNTPADISSKPVVIKQPIIPTAKKSSMQDFAKKVAAVTRSDEESSIEEDFESYKSSDSIEEDIYQDSFESLSDIIRTARNKDDDISEIVESIQDDLSSLHTDLKLNALPIQSPLNSPQRETLQRHAVLSLSVSEKILPVAAAKEDTSGVNLNWTSVVNSFTDILNNMLEPAEKKNEAHLVELFKEYNQASKHLEAMLRMKGENENLVFQEQTKLISEGIKIIQNKTAELSQEHLTQTQLLEVTKQGYDKLRMADAIPRTSTQTSELQGGVSSIQPPVPNVSQMHPIVESKYIVSAIQQPISVLHPKEENVSVKATVQDNTQQGNPQPANHKQTFMLPKDDISEDIAVDYEDDFDDISSISKLSTSIHDKEISLIKDQIRSEQENKAFSTDNVVKGRDTEGLLEAKKVPIDTKDSTSFTKELSSTIEKLQKETVVPPISETVKDPSNLIQIATKKEAEPVQALARDSPSTLQESVSHSTPSVQESRPASAIGLSQGISEEIKEEIDYEDDFDDFAVSVSDKANVALTIPGKESTIDDVTVTAKAVETSPTKIENLIPESSSPGLVEARLVIPSEIAPSKKAAIDTEAAETIAEELLSALLDDIVFGYLNAKHTTQDSLKDVKSQQKPAGMQETVEPSEMGATSLIVEIPAAAQVEHQKPAVGTPGKAGAPKISLSIPTAINKVADVLNENGTEQPTPTATEKAIVLTPLPNRQLSDSKEKKEKLKTSNPDLSVIPLDMQMMFALESILDAFQASWPKTKAFVSAPSLPHNYLDEFADISRDILPLIFDAINESFYAQFQSHVEYADPNRQFFKKAPVKPRPITVASLVSSARTDVLGRINCHSQFNNIPVANTLTNNFVKQNGPIYCNREQDDIAINLQISDEVMSDLVDDLVVLLLANK
ncbi:hypothetical protein HDV01_004195 [Terramyces sp. JEL0728]|nr:hypothetical protein HDV01_004195 [Terramyces sp. JEL0728]